MNNPDKSRLVILKADDYGNLRPANRGINELVAKGLLSSVGAMMPFTRRQDAEELHQAITISPLKGDVSIVLHTNFQTGKPVSDPALIPSLVDSNGRFKRPYPTAQAWKDYSSEVKENDASRELDAQIEHFRLVFGHYPDALDSHNIILAVPPLARIAMEKAKELGIPITLPYLYGENFGPGPLAAQVVHSELLRQYQEEGIPTADYTYPNDKGTHIYLNSLPLEEGVLSLLHGLRTLRQGVTQIVFHPIHPDEPRIPSDSEAIDAGRKRDYQMLVDSRVIKRVETLRRENRVISFKSLRRG